MNKEGLISVAQKLVGSQITIADRTGFKLAKSKNVVGVAPGETDKEVVFYFEGSASDIAGLPFVKFTLGQGMKVSRS